MQPTGYSMNLGINLILGLALIAYGLYMLMRRQTAPQKIEKLQALIESHGLTTGSRIHLLGHTLVPSIAGIALVITHFLG
jgi:hypothetical protein